MSLLLIIAILRINLCCTTKLYTILNDFTISGGYIRTKIDPCPHCDYRTKGVTQMKFHMVTVHNDKSFGEAVIYQCTYCDYKTYSKQHHRLHVKMKHEIPMGKI